MKIVETVQRAVSGTDVSQSRGKTVRANMSSNVLPKHSQSRFPRTRKPDRAGFRPVTKSYNKNPTYPSPL